MKKITNYLNNDPVFGLAVGGSDTLKLWHILTFFFGMLVVLSVV